MNDAAVRSAADYVLYWSRYNRRAAFNHALNRAVQWANQLDLPVLFYEQLDRRDPFGNHRLHLFLSEGAANNAADVGDLGIGYAAGDNVAAEASGAALVVTDDHPLAPGAPDFGIRTEAVDSSCIVPMSRFPKQEYAAYSLRPKMRKLLPEFLRSPQKPRVRQAWRGNRAEIDHAAGPRAEFRGGAGAAHKQLGEFLRHRLRRYARDKNEPAARATSDLSPWLRSGHISSLEVALKVSQYAERHKLIADEFLEELIVRRELAYNFARYSPRLDSLGALPAWARETLRRHARNRRPATYTPDQFEAAATHDALWNATQRELLLRGKIHGYYRMYWGKKIIEWSPTHAEALATMIRLHDRYALDGQDPNTYANILWCFGLHDRPWPQRPVFGTVRYMSLAGMEPKTAVSRYIESVEALERSAEK